MAKSKTPKVFTEIKCPHCGNTDVDKMEYVEDVQSTRTLSFKNGTLYYSEESHEDVEFAENTRLCCKACSKEFPIPEGLPLDMESRY